MSCSDIKTTGIKCDVSAGNENPLRIDPQTLEVKVGDVTYGKLKTIIVANEKMEFTIQINSEMFNTTTNE